MKNIKFLPNNFISLNGLIYKPYLIGELPVNFGCLNYNGKDGIMSWFGYKGFCYILAP